MKQFKNISLPGRAFPGLIILILTLSLSFCIGENLYENSITVKGKVSDISKKGIYRSAIVKFTTKEGKKVIFISKLDVSVDLFDYKIGQEVEVIYGPKDAHGTASINTFAERNATKIMY